MRTCKFLQKFLYPMLACRLDQGWSKAWTTAVIQLCWGLSMVGTVKSCPLTELSIEAFNMAVPLVPVIHVSPRPLTVGLTESTNGLCWEVAVLFAGKWPCFLLGSGRG